MSEGSNISLSEPPRNRSSSITSPTDGNKQKSKPSTAAPCALSYIESNSCSEKKVLPAIRSKQDEFFMGGDLVKSGVQRDFIPLDILTSLTQIPSPPSTERLGPPSKFTKSSAYEVRFTRSNVHTLDQTE